MPRDVITGVYSKPATATATAGQKILAARHNTLVNDLETVLNEVLYRDGKQAMTAPLTLSGDVTNPLEAPPLRQVISTVGFATRAAAGAATVPAPIAAIYVRGHTTEGIGGAWYARLGSAPSPAKAWHFQSADGAWWEMAFSRLETSFSYGAVGDFSADDTAKLQAHFDRRLEFGGEAVIPPGLYKLSSAGSAPCLALDSTISDEPPTDRKQISIVGSGAGSTVLYGNTPGRYALKLIGGIGVESHNYEAHRDFSISGLSSSYGLWVFNKAFFSLENLTIQGLNTGVTLESVVSATFRNLRIANNVDYGVVGKRGAGFSNVNNIHWDSCKFQSCGKFGYYGDTASTALTFTSCAWEGNGTQGDVNTGQMRLVFDATEGGVGCVINGGYVEAGAGDFDFAFVNTGTAYVTVVLNGVTFNRASATRYTNGCIKTVGKIKLVLNGCAFKSYNGYIPSAGRPYVSGDSELIFNHINCVFQDTVEAPTSPSGTYRVAAYFNGTGATGAKTAVRAGNLTSITKNGTGDYTLTFSPASGAAYFASILTDIPGPSQIVALNSTIFQFRTFNSGGVLTDPSNIAVQLFD